MDAITLARANELNDLIHDNKYNIERFKYIKTNADIYSIPTVSLRLHKHYGNNQEPFLQTIVCPTFVDQFIQFLEQETEQARKELREL